MTTFYATFTLLILTLVVALSSSDHGSKEAFAKSIRSAGQFEKR
mgnify:CR=1 FL=1